MMKSSSHFVLGLFLSMVLSSITVSAFTSSGTSPKLTLSAHTQEHVRSRTVLNVASGEKIMSDVDIMCIANTAELCSFYEECNIEEQEAIINRFEEQKGFLAERLAMMQALTKHISRGDEHAYPSEEEVEIMKGGILKHLSGL
ncbi:unnamed protein product [Heterosigma akashiwo]|mmetsp:Transcript_5032/g.8608  ORF Transcript_5032/g.8608 Transcript_5032/m.8608 type:complete len:143 (+) Transcript_5032:76-504(+)